ncbi:MAG: bifunctional DNA primase/polymerase [Patescibacteria group bacterium]|nr:bifunctional DNA primase/polymerase [Patescibacteria group bacterium]
MLARPPRLSAGEEIAILKHALAYARKGRPVFPCGADKSPATPNGFLNASTQPELIKAMWANHHDALIGTPTGNGVIVIDIDGEEGSKSLDSLSFALSPLPETRETATARGRHLWFKVPCAVRNSVEKLAPKVDVRGDGGYVILPPSKHPNGKLYRWTRQGDPASLPQDWLDAILSLSTPVSADAETGSNVQALRVFTENEQIPSGRRNATLASLAGSMRRRGMSYEAILSGLQAENRARCIPPLPEREVERIARSCSRYAPDPAASKPADRQPSKPVASSALVVKCFKDIQPKRVEWLWPGVVPLGKLTMLVGDPGLGKSLITIDLASRLSTDGKLPDSFAQPGPTIFLTSEDDEEDTLRPRLDVCGADVSRIHIIQMAISNGEERMFNLKRDLSALEEVIESVGAVLVVIDPISAYLGDSDSNNNAEVRSVLGPLSVVAKRHGCSVIAINHFRKSSGPAVQKSAMSMAFAAHARAVWGVARDRVDPETRLFLPIKANLGKDAEGWAYKLQDVAGVPVIEWMDKKSVGNVDYVFNGPQGHTKREESS